jgi:hypothetical protein
MLIRLHVNKFEIKKGKKGYPWTLHTSKGCIRAKEVEVRKTCRTEFKPELPHNPKVFLRVDGVIKALGQGRFVIM